MTPQPSLTGPALFQKVLASIVDAPQIWDQEVYMVSKAEDMEYIEPLDYPFGTAPHACGTCGCIAGWAIHHAFDSFDQFQAWHDSNVRGVIFPIEVAARLLGLPLISGWDLFDSNNNMWDIIQKAQEDGLLDLTDPQQAELAVRATAATP